MGASAGESFLRTSFTCAWFTSPHSATKSRGLVVNPDKSCGKETVRTGVLLAIKRSKNMSKDFGVMLIFYGLFLVLCGSAGAWLHNFEKKAMHSLYAGLGGSLAMLACGLFAASNIKACEVCNAKAIAGTTLQGMMCHSLRIGIAALPLGTERPLPSCSHVLVAIGVHLALVLMLIFIAVFSIQAFKSYGNPEKFDRLVLFVVMGLGSGIALAKAISMKPKKEKK
eukprot:s321_g24.t2